VRATAGVTVIAALIAPSTSHAAVTSIRLKRAVSLRLPANAGPGLSVIAAASCVGVGLCTLAGTYTDASSVEQPMVVTRAGGHWARAIELRLPSGSASVGATAESVSCPKVGSCVAAGGYEQSSHFHVFTATESHGTWRRAIGVKLPGNAMAPGDASAGGIACTGPGNCVLVGAYLDQLGHPQGMVVTEFNGKWGRARELRPPGNAGSAGGVFVNSIACPKIGSCVAVGRYNDKAGHARAMALAESNGNWHQATQLILPQDAAAVPLVSIPSVACTGAGSCIAVGQYRNRLGMFLAMSVTESRGVWAHARQVTKVPANAKAQASLFLNSVACAHGGPCLATGDYGLKSGGLGAVALTRSGAKWTAAAQISTPPDGATGAKQDALGQAAGCSPGGFCAVGGLYRTSSLTTRDMAAVS